MKFWKYYKKLKKINPAFILGVQKVRHDARIPNVISELSLNNILPLFGRSTVRRDQNCDFNDFFRFFCQNRGKILSKLNSETIFWIFSSMQTFIATNMKAWLKIYFFGFTWYFQNFVSYAPAKKNGEKDFVFIFTSHGTGLAPKTWKTWFETSCSLSTRWLLSD